MAACNLQKWPSRWMVPTYGRLLRRSNAILTTKFPGVPVLSTFIPTQKLYEDNVLHFGVYDNQSIWEFHTIFEWVVFKELCILYIKLYTNAWITVQSVYNTHISISARVKYTLGVYLPNPTLILVCLWWCNAMCTRTHKIASTSNSNDDGDPYAIAQLFSTLSEYHSSKSIFSRVLFTGYVAGERFLLHRVQDQKSWFLYVAKVLCSVYTYKLIHSVDSPTSLFCSLPPSCGL